MDLNKLGYSKEGNNYIKPFGEYRVVLFPVSDGFMRRITKNGQVIDLRKVPTGDVEGGKIMEIVLREMPLNTQTIPTIVEPEPDLTPRFFLRINEKGEVEFTNKEPEIDKSVLREVERGFDPEVFENEVNKNEST